MKVKLIQKNLKLSICKAILAFAVAFSANACASILDFFLPDKKETPIGLQFNSESKKINNTILINRESGEKSAGAIQFTEINGDLVVASIRHSRIIYYKLQIDKKETQDHTEYYIFDRYNFNLIATIKVYEHLLHKNIPPIYKLRSFYFSGKTLHVMDDYENASFEFEVKKIDLSVERYKYSEENKSSPTAIKLKKEILDYLGKKSDEHTYVSFAQYSHVKIKEFSNFNLPVSFYVDKFNKGGFTATVKNDEFAPNIIPTTGYIVTVDRDKNGELFLIRKEYDARLSLNLDKHFDTSDLNRRIYVLGNDYLIDIENNFLHYRSNSPPVINDSYFNIPDRKKTFIGQKILFLMNGTWVSAMTDIDKYIMPYYSKLNKGSFLYVFEKNNSYEIGKLEF